MKAKMKLLSWKSWLSSFHSCCFRWSTISCSALYSKEKLRGQAILQVCLHKTLRASWITKVLPHCLRPALLSGHTAWQLLSRRLPLFYIVPELPDSLSSKVWSQKFNSFLSTTGARPTNTVPSNWWLPNNPISRIQKPKSFVQSHESVIIFSRTFKPLGTGKGQKFEAHWYGPAILHRFTFPVLYVTPKPHPYLLKMNKQCEFH